MFLCILLLSFANATPDFNGTNLTNWTRDKHLLGNVPSYVFNSFPFLAYGYAGIFSLQDLGNGKYSGSINYDNFPVPNGNSQTWEPLTNIVFLNDLFTIYVTFVRARSAPYPAETYYLMFDIGLSGVTVNYYSWHGHLTKAGFSTAYPFHAALDVSTPPIFSQSGPNQYGQFAILSHGYAGTVTINSDLVSGTLIDDSGPIPGGTSSGVTETLSFVFIVQRYGAWYYTFYRSGPDQLYYAIAGIGANSVQLWGHFYSNGNSYPYPFCGAKRKAGTSQGPWTGSISVLAHGYAGQVYVNPGYPNPPFGWIYFNGGALPNGIEQDGQQIQNLVVGSHQNNQFLYVTYLRPGGQLYYGLFDPFSLSIHGHFTDPNWAGYTWPYDGKGGLPT